MMWLKSMLKSGTCWARSAGQMVRMTARERYEAKKREGRRLQAERQDRSKISARRGGCSPAHSRSAIDPTDAEPKHRSRPRNRRVSNDVLSPFGTRHRHRLHAQAPARV